MATVQIKGGETDNHAIVTENGELLVAGSMVATNPSIGSNGQTAPTMATQIAGVDPSGDLTPVRVDDTGALVTSVEMTIQEGFSTIVPGYPTQVPVGISSTQLLPPNSQRAYAHVINNTSYKIYVQYGVDAQMNKGFPVTAGGTLFISGNDLFRGRINGISPVSDTLIDVLDGEK